MAIPIENLAGGQIGTGAAQIVDTPRTYEAFQQSIAQGRADEEAKKKEQDDLVNRLTPDLDKFDAFHTHIPTLMDGAFEIKEMIQENPEAYRTDPKFRHELNEKLSVWKTLAAGSVNFKNQHTALTKDRLNSDEKWEDSSKDAYNALGTKPIEEMTGEIDYSQFKYKPELMSLDDMYKTTRGMIEKREGTKTERVGDEIRTVTSKHRNLSDVEDAIRSRYEGDESFRFSVNTLYPNMDEDQAINQMIIDHADPISGASDYKEGLRVIRDPGEFGFKADEANLEHVKMVSALLQGDERNWNTVMTSLGTDASYEIMSFEDKWAKNLGEADTFYSGERIRSLEDTTKYLKDHLKLPKTASDKELLDMINNSGEEIGDLLYKALDYKMEDPDTQAELYKRYLSGDFDPKEKTAFVEYTNRSGGKMYDSLILNDVNFSEKAGNLINAARGTDVKPGVTHKYLKEGNLQDYWKPDVEEEAEEEDYEQYAE